jgi:hypothetical protein
MSDVSSNGSHVTNLRTSDQPTSFHHAVSVLPQQFAGNDLLMSHSRTDLDPIPFLDNAPDASDLRDIDQSLHKRMPTLPELEKQISSTSNKGGVLLPGQQFKGFIQGSRLKILSEIVHKITSILMKCFADSALPPAKKGRNPC